MLELDNYANRYHIVHWASPGTLRMTADGVATPRYMEDILKLDEYRNDIANEILDAINTSGRAYLAGIMDAIDSQRDILAAE